MMRRAFAVSLAVVAAVFGSGDPARADPVRCLSDWSEARALVASEKLIPVEQVARLAPSKLGGDVVRIRLCHGKEDFFYRLVLRDASGNIREVTVDARAPF